MTRRIIHLVAGGATLLCALLSVQPVADATPNKSIADRVGPSLVHITTEYSGDVEVPFTDGSLWVGDLSMKAGCTGYIVDPAGYIATAGHCVNDKEEDVLNGLREQAVIEVAKQLGRDKEWAVNALEVAKREKWKVRDGSGAADALDRKVTIRQPVADTRIFAEETPVEVVDFQEFDEGDNAILKVSPPSGPLPALVISDKVPAPGDAITSIGFPGAVGKVVDQSTVPQPSYKSGSVSSRQTVEAGIVRTEVSAEMGTGMSGGPTVDANAEVIGTNSFGTRTDMLASFVFTTDNVALRTYLQSHGVTLQAEKHDSVGASMWLWLGPLIAVLVIALIVGIVLLVRRGNKRPPMPMPGGPGMPGTAAMPMGPQGPPTGTGGFPSAPPPTRPGPQFPGGAVPPPSRPLPQQPPAPRPGPPTQARPAPGPHPPMGPGHNRPPGTGGFGPQGPPPGRPGGFGGPPGAPYR